ncbi:ribose-5-phosphate isomerase RpiA [Paenibacillus puerhi]|uniref:ribose-5-phosphate isomerase RpiA n=1 Tax=Paenibacillus puerhi TaxID=2692622 RepID=UPI0013577381|nr:ribose-5-phosphate isomerase RpiA [Paenibacillus puerhi]
MEAKRAAAEKAVEYIEDGMIVGLGTGSTAYWAIQRIGQRMQEGLTIQAVATSSRTESLARELGIPIISTSGLGTIDLTIDGADEVDPRWNAIKGGGGALLREKIVAASSRQLILVVDESKLVDRLGRFPLPVEIVPFGADLTVEQLGKLGCVPTRRITAADGSPYLTDNGNYIVDCEFGSLADPEDVHDRINRIPGVVDNGLFLQMAGKVIVGYADRSVQELSR